VVLKCRSTDTVYWNFNNDKLPDNVKTLVCDTDSDLYILMITSPTVHNSGTYTCYGRHGEFGRPFDESYFVIIKGKL